MKSKAILFLLLIIAVTAKAQERKELLGRVVSDVGGTGIPGLYVINKETGGETKTAAGGNFSLEAKPGDVLVVYSNRTGTREFKLNEQAFAEKPFVMSVFITSYELEEVIIDKDTITAESLGLVPKGQKRYTPAERRLKTAGDFKPVHLLGLIAGGMPIDPILNAINGKTKRLKKELKLEKKEMLLQKVKGMYTEGEIRDKFKIPSVQVEGFIYYIIEDSQFAAAVNANDYETAQFRMAVLAEKYLKLQKNEN
ncbi:hypothetical protein [Flavobacterium sp. MK4S-17]|jgi:hypothetical protein|uniref:hypothetical protein n=1 Tax=Flavobacterium sp. MK4S-17 TaxID=2543737 RepID=UPI0013568AF6|nr:hypothetical protein [Flavobacterium sp. MK4S-17]